VWAKNLHANLAETEHGSQPSGLGDVGQRWRLSEEILQPTSFLPYLDKLKSKKELDEMLQSY